MGENAGAVFNRYSILTPPQIAIGDLRECLSALIAKAEARALLEKDPARRRKHNRLVRYLTLRLARAIIAESEHE